MLGNGEEKMELSRSNTLP